MIAPISYYINVCFLIIKARLIEKMKKYISFDEPSEIRWYSEAPTFFFTPPIGIGVELGHDMSCIVFPVQPKRGMKRHEDYMGVYQAAPYIKHIPWREWRDMKRQQKQQQRGRSRSTAEPGSSLVVPFYPGA